MANPRNKLKSYTKVACETAPPGQIVLMLFDGILRFLDSACEGFKEPNPIRRNETINNNLLKAQAIVTELQSSLDMKVEGNLPMTLYRLYDYFTRELNEANRSKTQQPIDNIVPFVKELRDGWAEMLTKQGGEKPVAAQTDEKPSLRKSA